MVIVSSQFCLLWPGLVKGPIRTGENLRDPIGSQKGPTGKRAQGAFPSGTTNFIHQMEFKHHYFVTGSIGVGKSTSLKEFMWRYGSSAIKTYFIQEYIDFDCMGAKMLQDWLDGDMSLLAFQLYIVGQFRKQLDTEEYRNAKFVIWERHPMETLKVFASDLKRKEKMELQRVLEDLCDTYRIPKIDMYLPMRGVRLSTYHLAPQTIADIIYDLMKADLVKEESSGLFIYLYVPRSLVREQQKRIQERGRPMEVRTYSDIDALIAVNDKYTVFANTYLDGNLLNGTEY